MRGPAWSLWLALPGIVAPAAGLADEIALPPASYSLSLDDFQGMQPRPGLEDRIARVEGLLQRRPVDGDPVSQPTQIYLAHDAAHLYAVFVCFDSDPSRVRARWRNRDALLNDDLVSIQLDTFRDQRRAYVFAVNPLGVQADAVWVEGEGFDTTFDAVWDAATRFEPDGYLVWVRIPFSSLRFSHADDQRWGVLLNRDIPRHSEESFWPRYSTHVQGRLNQIGSLSGLREISPAGNLRVIPHAVSRASRTLDPGANGPAVDSWEGEAGIDAKLVMRDSFVVDATLNPDFSQVESDEPQITVNQRFERLFPEKRPFFLENANYFASPIPLVFTRRIVEPSFGVRLTGKQGRWGVGGFLADDGRRREPAAGDASARVGVLRVSRELARQSSLGFTATARSDEASSNQVGALDGRFRFSDTWVGTLQVAGSRVARTALRDQLGHALELLLRHESRYWVSESALSERSTDFRAELGFIPRVGIRQARQKLARVFRPENRTLITWSPGVDVLLTDDPQGPLLDWEVKPSLAAELKQQTTLGINARVASERLRPEDVSGLVRPLDLETRRWGASVETNAWAALSLRAEAVFGQGINLTPRTGVEPGRGRHRELVTSVTVRPHRRLEIVNTYLYSTLRQGGRAAFSSHSARSKWNYQFSKAASLRSILQLDQLTSDPDLSSLRSDRRLNLDVLFTYLVQPGKALHLGVGSNWDGDLADPLWLRNDSLVLFAKISYAFP